MRFRTQFDQHDRHLQPAGNRIHDILSGRFDDSGIFVLDVSGTEDIYTKIQSHAASCDIHVILDRFRRGDLDVLGDPSRSVFLDASEMPRNYAQLLNLVADGERAFMSLPVEERAKFDHSFAQWLMSFDKTIESSKPASEPASDNKEVSSNES